MSSQSGSSAISAFRLIYKSLRNFDSDKISSPGW
jgi:hypothetical protein